MTKKERINRKRLARYWGSYSKIAREKYDFLVHEKASKHCMLWIARKYIFYRIEYDIERGCHVSKYHKQYAIIGCRLAKKIHRENHKKRLTNPH